jgi:hypothetical protein
MAGGYAKVSVTLPASLVERIKTRVGERGVSRYVAQALEAEERREALRAWLTEQDAEYGPLSHDAMEQVRREWLGGVDPID